ncbi:hypothetical protein PE066_00640 [Ramlibacter tataouinensis]|uniref:hypothetical protein n=1 Tax=Ramlibacter tataouinensis TaxID=94132 RepID=UPI0022F3AC06|nr:hypothetical protein [Ramlibacter tataouinensis]WBY02080.1 hypothetical protein PE066_00640 [Ramlibacter tataouinensis]
MVAFANYFSNDREVHVITLENQDSLYVDPGFRGNWQELGVHVHFVRDPVPKRAIRASAHRNSSRLGLLRAFLRYSGIDKDFLAGLKLLAKVWRLRSELRGCIVLGSFPGGVNVFVAACAKFMLKGVLFVDFRDAWTLDADYSFNVFTPVTKMLERYLVKSADVLSFVSTGVSLQLIDFSKRKGLSKLITNGADKVEVVPDDRQPGVRVFGYFGSLTGAGRDFGPVIEALKVLKARSNVCVQFDIYTSDKREDILEFVERAGVTNAIRVHAPVSMKKFFSICASWDAGLVITRKDPRARGELTTKLFDYVAAGLPVVALAPDGFDIHQIVREIPTSASLAPEKTEALAELLAKHDFCRLKADVARRFTREAILAQSLEGVL